MGAAACRWLVLPRARSDAPQIQDATWALAFARRKRAAGVGALGAGLTIAGVALYFLRQLLEFRDPFVPWTEDASLLLSTPWGTAWKLAAAGAVASLTSLLVARTGRSAAWAVATALALAMAAFPTFTGHASGVEDGRTLALVADWLHVVAAGGWIGGLAVVLYVGRLGGSDGSGLEDLVPPFSTLAMASVAVLVVTGSLASWIHLPGVGALFSTTYGRTLSLKLLIVAGVLALGARNNRILKSRLDTDAGREAMRRSATLELLVAQVVLLVTALLVRTSPPMGS
ncbi:MAG: CopD family protein [Longimicrobiales bacterium]|nr:CopD family protein [Longimicrobiales bacterium]